MLYEPICQTIVSTLIALSFHQLRECLKDVSMLCISYVVPIVSIWCLITVHIAIFSGRQFRITCLGQFLIISSESIEVRCFQIKEITCVICWNTYLLMAVIALHFIFK